MALGAHSRTAAGHRLGACPAPTLRRLRRTLLALALGAALTAGQVASTGTPAAAVTPDVSVTPSTAPAGSATTLTYRATVVRAGTLASVTFAIPPGSTGRPTSVNGTLTTPSRGYLRWTAARPPAVSVGSRLAIPVYGLTLPSTVGSWSLALAARSTTGVTLTSGYAPFSTTKAVAGITVSPSTAPPATSLTLTYRGVVARSGVLRRVEMRLPAGSGGRLTSINGTVTTISPGVVAWTPSRGDLAVAAGAKLAIPLYGLVTAGLPGTSTVSMTARAADLTTSLGGGSTSYSVAYVPPAPMPAVPVEPMPTGLAGCPGSWPSTVEENLRSGDAEWTIASTSPTTLAAYATTDSAACGDVVGRRVHSDTPYRVTAYRMGHYDGLGARRVWSTPQALDAVAQPAPVTGGTDALGRDLAMTTAPWSTTLQVGIEDTFVPGTYLFRVENATEQTYVPLTVRDDTGTVHDVLLQQATATWQAYNRWGGNSFYSTPGSGRLSNDRPYAEGQGSGQFLPLEVGLVRWAESQGIDVTYWTNQDLERFGGQLPQRARTLLLPAHDEYWSLGMRAALTQAVAAGVNVANLGANTIHRRITYRPGLREWDIDRYTSWPMSSTWRWSGLGHHEQAVLGAQYGCAVADDLVTNSSFLFAGVAAGTVVPGFIAGEQDYVHRNVWRPSTHQVQVHGDAWCFKSGATQTFDMTTSTAPSGARVFNGSTFAYGCFLGGVCPTSWKVVDPPASSRSTVATMMRNLMTWVGRGEIEMPGVPGTTSPAPTTGRVAPVPVEVLPPSLPVEVGAD